MPKRINAADFQQRAPEILSQVHETRAAYIVEDQGVPIAAIVSVEDLARLEESAPAPKRNVAEALASLERARAVREMIRRKRGNKKPTDSVATIRYLRQMRGKRLLKGQTRAKTNLR